MFSTKRHIVLLGLILSAFSLPAQNLTGTWEGSLGSDQFLQLNIIQTGDKICGYTFDHVKSDERSFCKAFFEGRFDRKRNMLIIQGKYFLKNSGSHILMYLKLDYRMKNGREILKQDPRQMIAYRERLTARGFVIEPYIEADSTEYVNIQKVADQPYELNALMQDCIARDKKKDETVKRVIPPKDSVPDVVKVIIPEKLKDSMPPVIVSPPVTKKTDSILAPETIARRKNKEQKRIIVDVKTINLKVYDNAIMDGDTVSILYNGKMLLTHQLLTEKGIELNIELDEKQNRHEIILFAESLGSIPPNTALIVVTAGTKRYELFASANLQENAVLVFEYKPK